MIQCYGIDFNSTKIMLDLNLYGSLYLKLFILKLFHTEVNKMGGVAQMVERSLSMREVPGSIPGASRTFLNHKGQEFSLYS